MGRISNRIIWGRSISHISTSLSMRIFSKTRTYRYRYYLCQSCAMLGVQLHLLHNTSLSQRMGRQWRKAASLHMNHCGTSSCLSVSLKLLRLPLCIILPPRAAVQTAHSYTSYMRHSVVQHCHHSLVPFEQTISHRYPVSRQQW